MESKGSSFLSFFRPEVRMVDGKPSSVFSKEVYVTEDLHFHIKCLGQSVDSNGIGLTQTKVSSAHDIEEIIELVDSCSICNGHHLETNFESSVAYKDFLGTYRHRKCPILKVDAHKHCQYCNNLRRSVNRKRKATIQGDVKPKKPKVLNLLSSEETKRNIIKLRKNKKLLIQKSKRLKKRYESLRQQFATAQEKMSNLSSTDLSNILNNEKIAQNQKEAIQEIVSACKHSNSKGRRYSQHWILLCLLLHMRSPKGYRLLQDENILALPSIRTVRR